jgi:hypothetical protein
MYRVIGRSAFEYRHIDIIGERRVVTACLQTGEAAENLSDVR